MKNLEKTALKVPDLESHIERTLPIQIHCAISEVFREVTGKTYMMELIDYEKKKVTELIDFSLATRGKEPSI